MQVHAPVAVQRRRLAPVRHRGVHGQRHARSVEPVIQAQADLLQPLLGFVLRLRVLARDEGALHEHGGQRGGQQRCGQQHPEDAARDAALEKQVARRWRSPRA
ncbi:MAG: hypothetical protein U1F49_17100 [Rubrivivax sp.]